MPFIDFYRVIVYIHARQFEIIAPYNIYGKERWVLEKPTVTPEALKSLLLIRFHEQQSTSRKLYELVMHEVGIPIEEESPERVAISNKLMDSAIGMIAQRLSQGRDSTPLFSSQDFVQLVPSYVREVVQTMDYQPTYEQYELLEKYLATVFGNVVETMCGMVRTSSNPYDEHWRWVSIVLDLAVARRISSAELLASPDGRDEIQRHMHTKEEFVSLYQQSMAAFLQVDHAKKTYVDPMLDAVATQVDEEERREWRQQMEANIMSPFREAMARATVIVNAWINEQAERIYPITL